MQLRYEARDVPYYRVIGEFFNKKLGNFAGFEQSCQFNTIELEAAKKKAAEEAVLKFQASNP